MFYLKIMSPKLIVCFVNLLVLIRGDGELSTMPPPVYDTIVVGMGASGVTALSTLARAGKSVLGLEAQSYVGGRVKTIDFGKGVVEMGAEWIHGERPSRVFELANENNMPIRMQELETELYRSDGVRADSELINELLAFCIDIIDHPPSEAQPLGDFITRKLREHLSDRPSVLNDTDFMTGFLDLMNLIVNNYESSNDWNDVTTSSKYTPLDGHQHWSWHKYGYRTFFNILLNTFNNGTGLPAEIMLNKEVENVQWSQDPAEDVVVKCRDGSQYRSKNIIVTVSLGVLKERHASLFTPQLPEAKAKAIDNLTIGLMDKLIFSFDEEWWPKHTSLFSFLWMPEDKAKVAREDEWTTKIYGFSRPLGSDNCITFWTCGDSAKYVETLPDDLVKDKVMGLLRRFMGSNYTIPEPTGMVKSYWYTNQFTRGSYTYDSVSSHLHPTARADLATPLLDSEGRPRVMFAGEATNEYHFSTVHGASETGLREANRLIKPDELTIKSKL